MLRRKTFVSEKMPSYAQLCSGFFGARSRTTRRRSPGQARLLKNVEMSIGLYVTPTRAPISISLSLRHRQNALVSLHARRERPTMDGALMHLDPCLDPTRTPLDGISIAMSLSS